MRGLIRAIVFFAGLIAVVAILSDLQAKNAKLDAEAVKAGFSSSSDQARATNAGITDPAAWARRVAAEEQRRKKEYEEQDIKISACVHAEHAVKQRLKAPSTATFPSCWRYEVRASPDMKTVFVKGYVDAQNSFGAMLRSTFVVKLKHEGNKQWTVLAAAID